MVAHPSIAGDETEAQRRRRSRRALLVAFAVIVVVLLHSAIAPAVWIVRAGSEIRRLDAAFVRIEERFAFLMRQLKIADTSSVVSRFVAAPPLTIDREGEVVAAGGKITTAERKAEGLAD